MADANVRHIPHSICKNNFDDNILKKLSKHLKLQIIDLEDCKDCYANIDSNISLRSKSGLKDDLSLVLIEKYQSNLADLQSLTNMIPELIAQR